MRCKAAVIDKIHGLLQVDLAMHVIGDTEITQPPPRYRSAAWKKLHAEGPFSFDLLADPLSIQVFSPSRRPMHELKQVGNGDVLGWVSWHERWNKTRGADEYSLIDASFSFCWGPRTQLDQLFRAEWSLAGNVAERAAHPRSIARAQAACSRRATRAGRAANTQPASARPAPPVVVICDSA